ANVTRTSHIMFTMGTDFKYQYANTWFRQLDKLIHYVNKDGRVNVLYSSPSIYTDAKHAAKETWPFKTEDFFPYADSANGYWTGFFTSRPALKGFIRTLSSYYLAARQLEFFNGKNSSGYTTDTLADALAINQHHDAVTGTEKQHVADDYAKRLSIGYAESEKVVEHGLSYLSELHLSNVSTRKFEQCSLLNITYCPPSEAGISEEKSLVVLVYNSLGWKREDIIKIPVANEHVVVKNSEGIEIVAQLLPIANASIHLRNTHVKIYLGRSIGNTPNFWLSFEVSVPPLGFTTYFVSYAEQKGSKTAMSTVDKSHTEKNSIKVGQGNLKLYYDRNGQLHHYSNKRNMLKESLHQSFGYYSSDDGSGFDLQASGAYIFRPKGVIHIETSGQSQLKVLRGPIVDEIHQQMNPWIYQITRVYKGKEHGEIEYIVGPIPVDDTIGKEVVTQITTPMLTNKSFFTDSNGRDFIKRVRDYRSDWKLDVNQPISGNYYPINLGIYIKDDTRELSMMVDRSVGGSSIHDGQIELMLHRRLLQDDSKGVGEPLNEVVCDADKCFGLMVLTL
ncbi:putative Lysosomal alpha-mannosidase, partial [Zostera marina]